MGGVHFRLISIYIGHAGLFFYLFFFLMESFFFYVFINALS